MKIRLTTFARTDESLLALISRRYLSGKYRWKDLEFVTDDSYDKMIIFTSPHRDTVEYNPGKCITMLTEPPNSPNRVSHLTGRTEEMYLPLPWLPGQIYGKSVFGGDGNLIVKNNLLSVITSDLNYLDGHKARLEFVYYLDKMIEQGLDIWGKSHSKIYFSHITNYRGSIRDKYLGLWSYKYHLACENSFEPGYFTEKIIDPIIAESLCFYDGCTNIETFIDEKAFVKINIKNAQASVELILKSIKDNLWAKKVKYIRTQKSRMLTTLHPINLIWLTAHEKDVLKYCQL
ncbi:glycosyltransferase family 10 domain-containing protein [Pedobacter sp. MW01-1-1]|uniref:glycosyltransferase family 10 domain-containing protein n=1 Tax=Pedobacter sp. MW01-1-1 TaxID=3383027 RepID=UPI003FED7B3C